MFVTRDHGRPDAVKVQQLESSSGILTGDDLGLSQDPQPPKRHVFHVSYGSGYHDQRHGKPSRA